MALSKIYLSVALCTYERWKVLAKPRCFPSFQNCGNFLWHKISLCVNYAMKLKLYTLQITNGSNNTCEMFEKNFFFTSLMREFSSELLLWNHRSFRQEFYHNFRNVQILCSKYNSTYKSVLQSISLLLLSRTV